MGAQPAWFLLLKVEISTARKTLEFWNHISFSYLSGIMSFPCSYMAKTFAPA